MFGEKIKPEEEEVNIPKKKLEKQNIEEKANLPEVLEENYLKNLLHKEEEKNRLEDLSNLDNIKYDKLFVYGNDEENEEIQIENQDEKGRDKSNHKFSLDMMDESNQKLHDFLNGDLIKAIEICPGFPCEKSNLSEKSTKINDTNSFDSHNFSLHTSLKIKPIIEEDIHQNQNTFFLQSNIEHNSISFFSPGNSKNKNSAKVKNQPINNGTVKEDTKEKYNEPFKENETLKLKDSIDEKNLLDVRAFIPEKICNQESQNSQKEGNEKDNSFKQQHKIRNFPRNKFDDSIKTTLSIQNTKRSEKTKMPTEIRTGDWICLYCYNFNFSFRIKCNRCGLFRRSSLQRADMEEFKMKGFNGPKNYDLNNNDYYQYKSNDKQFYSNNVQKKNKYSFTNFNSLNDVSKKGPFEEFYKSNIQSLAPSF